MKKILKDQISKVKLEIKNRYLAGESILSIAEDMGVVERTIYFHLGELTAQDKGLHAQNSDLRKDAKKGKTKEVKHGKTKSQAKPKVKTKDKDDSPKGQAKRKSASSLDDFIKG